MRNLAAYIVEVPSDAYINHWSTAITHMESFFRRYHTQVSDPPGFWWSTTSYPSHIHLLQISAEGASKPTRAELESAIIVMSHVLKVQNFSAFKVGVLYLKLHT